MVLRDVPGPGFAFVAPASGDAQRDVALDYGNPTHDKGSRVLLQFRGCESAPIRCRLFVNSRSKNAC